MSRSVRPTMLSLIAGGLLLFGCGAEPPLDRYEPSIPEVEGVSPELTFYVQDGERALFGGFDGALSQGVSLPLRGPDGDLGTVVPDENGRFSIELSPQARLSAGALEYRLREAAQARAAAVHPPLSGAGAQPNDLVIAGSDDAFGVVVRSGDSGVSAVDLEEGLTGEGVRVFGDPYAVAVIDAAARRVAVAAFDAGVIEVVDLTLGVVERTLSPLEVELDAPFTLARPYDVDGDGAPEEQIARFLPASPQSAAISMGRLYVGFSSFQAGNRGDEPPVFLPGVLGIWALDDLDAPPKMRVLPALNPQEIRPLPGGRILIVCSGALDLAGGPHAGSAGAVVVYDPVSRDMEVVDMGDFLPGTAVFAAGRLVVGSLARGEIRWMQPDGSDVRTMQLNEEAIDSVFRMVELGGGLVGVPSYNTDRLHIFDARTGELDPPPFYAPIPVGPGRPVFDGLKVVARRPGRRGVDFVGPDLFVLTGDSSELIPIELRKVLGP